MFLAVKSRSASSRTIAASLPPSSSMIGRIAAKRPMFSPTGVEPVKLMKSTALCSTMQSPITEPRPVIEFKTPAGIPASTNASTKRRPEIEPCVGGLKATTSPAIKAGAILEPAKFTGQLNGEIASTRPTGSRRTTAIFFLLPASKAPPSSTSPSKRKPSSAAQWMISAVRTTSPIADFKPLEISLERTCPIFSASRSKISAAL